MGDWNWPLRLAVMVATGFCGIQIGFAADLAGAPAPVPSVNWTGFYVGADVAESFATALYKRPFNTALSDTSIGSINGKLGVGGYGGFNYQVAPWAVVGIEASATWLGASYREQGATLDFLEHANSVYAVTGRAGVLVTPDTLVYGKVGPAWIDVNGFQGFGDSLNQVLPAAQVGVGIETRVTRNVAVRVDASYTGATQTLVINSGSDRYQPSIMQIQVGAEYNFDAPPGWGVRASPPVALTPNWTGFEVGGFVSLNGDQEKYNDTNQGATGPFARFAVGGGGFVGANYEIAQRYVIGAEVSGNFDHATFVNAAGTNTFFGPQFDFGTVEHVWAATGRVGWLLSPSSLVYVKGGAAWIGTTTDFDYWNNIASSPTGFKTLQGYQAGLGIETFVTSNVSVRLEALYTGTNQKISLNGTLVANEFTLQPSILSVTTGVAVHF